MGLVRNTWERIGARVYDGALAKGEREGMEDRRRALLSGARGRVLEIGAGTGLNLPHYPQGLERLVLAEPVEPMMAQLRNRVADVGRPAEVVLAPAEELPFEDGSFETVVSTMVLCTVENPARAIAEVRRVLAPGGRLLFVEHVRAEAGRLGRWQDRLMRPWRAFGCGCTCNRSTVELLRAGGMAPADVREEDWRGMPPLVRPLRVGRAVAER